VNKISFYLVYIIIVISFTKGLLSILGFDEVYTQLVIEGLIVLFFFLSLLNSIFKGKYIYYNFFIMLMLIIVIFISFLMNNINGLQLILFIRILLIYYLFLYALLNIDFSQENINTILKLISVLFFIQIPASYIKLFLVGPIEYYVGTMQVLGGDLATIMPLMAIAFLISEYLVYNKIKYVVFIFLFISIGLISNKLGIIFYVAILFCLMSYIYSVKMTRKFISFVYIKKLFALVLIFGIIFILYVTINPRANPEHKVGGSVDIEYLLNYTKEYNTMKEKGSRVDGDGRFEAPLVALERLSKGGVFNLLFGFGPGDIIKSSYLKFKNPLLEKYRIGYGGRIGIVWLLMQIGIIGLIVFLFYHLLLFYRILRIFLTNNIDKKYTILNLTALGFIIILFLDLFSYSSIFINVPGVVLTYLFLIYVVITNKLKYE